jgi:peptidoglycan/LPS O-acetylase OafA/YrhL
MIKDRTLHIPSLDGIRGISALIVFLGHAGLGELVPGGFGVTVFFVLSGYLISTLLRMEHEATSTIDLPKFYLRRVYRIFPPLYLTLLVAAVLPLPHASSTPTLGGIAAQMCHLTNYYAIFFGENHLLPYTGIMWSLAIEEHFYLLYPLALRACLARFNTAKTSRILLAACAVVLIWRCLLVFWLKAGADYTYFATDTRADSLLFGCILGLWANPSLDTERFALGTRAWAWITAASVVLLISTFVYRNAGFRETFRYTLQSAALLPLFFASIRYSAWPVFRWLETAPLRGLGMISYTFYLIHMLALAATYEYLPALDARAQGVIALMLTISFSSAMYFLVEKRLGALRRRLHG